MYPRRLVGRLGVAVGFTAVASVAGLPVPAVAAPPPWHAGPCVGTEGVTVVADFTKQLDRVDVRCTLGDPATGRAALEGAGFAVVDDAFGFVCTVDGRPVDPPGCSFPDGGFWSYWHAPSTAPGSAWAFSNVGDAAYDPAPGSVEGWYFWPFADGENTTPPTVGPSFATGPSADAVGALSWLSRELKANGWSLPGFDPATPDWSLTADAVLALAAGGLGRSGAATEATALLAAHINDFVTFDAIGVPNVLLAGPLGKSLLVAALQGTDVTSFGGRNLDADLRSLMQTTGPQVGRFSDRNTTDASNGFGQAFAMLGLARTPGGMPAASIEFLLDQQCADGGFRLFYDESAGCEGDESDTDATAMAVQALLAAPQTPPVSPATADAVSFLLDHQDAATGGWGGTGPTVAPNANSTGLIAQALRASGQTTAANGGRDWLATLQLSAANAGGTPADADFGAIAYNPGARDSALAGGITDLARDQWRRATAQAVLAFDLPAFGSVGDGGYHAVVPTRVADTRDGTGVAAGPLDAGDVLTVPIAGRAGVPADVTGVVLNVTAANVTAPGYLTVFPCGGAVPGSSNVNYSAHPVANLVTVGVGDGGAVCVLSYATADVVIDLSGWFRPGVTFTPGGPSRIADTRDGTGVAEGLLVAGGELVVPVIGSGGVPADATAVAVSVTVTEPHGDGYATAYPCGSAPYASNLNFVAGQTVPNAAVVGVGDAGSICVSASAAADIVVDVTGWFGVPTGAEITPVTPVRIADTRDGTGVAQAKVPAGGVLTVPAVAEADAAGVVGVVVNLTGVNGAADGYLTAYACGTTPPYASNVNTVAGEGRASSSAAFAPIDAQGRLCVTSYAASDIVVDLTAVVHR